LSLRQSLLDFSACGESTYLLRCYCETRRERITQALNQLEMDFASVARG
jgi:hypothetical protein